MTILKRLFRMMGFHVHEWGDWVTVGEIVSTIHKGQIGECQRSECKTCKKARVNKIWTC